MTSLSPYLHIIRTYARAERANSKRIVAAVVLSVLRVGLIAAIYRVAYRATPVSALSYANAIWSMAIYAAFIMNLGLRHIFTIVNSEVRTGNVEVALLKPVDWRLSKTCELLGKNGVEFLVQLVVLPVALLFMVGPPDVSHLTPGLIVVFIVLTVLAMVVASAMFLTIGLSAFWLNDAQPLFRLVDKTALIFGGAFVPIALLPAAAQLFVRYSPFGVYAAPTQLFNPGLAAHMTVTMIAALAWSVALLGLSQLVWAQAQRRIEVNGG